MAKSNLTEEQKEGIYNNFMSYIDFISKEKSALKQIQHMISLKDKLSDLYDSGFNDGHSQGLLEKSIKLN